MKHTHKPLWIKRITESRRYVIISLILMVICNCHAVQDTPDTAPTMKLSSANSDNWWNLFEDDTLNRLEALVTQNNYDAKSALKRIEASRQIVAQSKAGYYPTVSLSAGYDIGKSSGKETKPYSTTPTISYFQAGASISWEIDVFGRIRDKVKAGDAGVTISRMEYEGLMLTLTTEAATNYFNLIMYRNQLENAQSRLKAQQEVLGIVEARYKAGLISKLDVAQAKSLVNTTQLLIPTLQSEIETTINSLAVLCGVSDTDIRTMTAGTNLPTGIVIPADNISADLIRQRPDVAQAEAKIIEMGDNLGIARKEYLPTLALNANIGTSAHNIKDMFGKNSFSYEIAPTLSWTLFDGLSRKAAVAETKANLEALADTYEYTLSTAVGEVKNSIAMYNASVAEAQLYDDVISNDKEMVTLSIDRYRQGLADFSDVADAQVSMLSDVNQYEATKATLLNNIVAVCKAIGGKIY